MAKQKPGEDFNKRYFPKNGVVINNPICPVCAFKLMNIKSLDDIHEFTKGNAEKVILNLLDESNPLECINCNAKQGTNEQFFKITITNDGKKMPVIICPACISGTLECKNMEDVRKFGENAKRQKVKNENGL
ncbi:MAG: hypothetical protein ABUK01_12985 [Leptospirales bacterium]